MTLEKEDIVRALVYINSDITEEVKITNNISLIPISKELKDKYIKENHPHFTYTCDLRYVNYYFEFKCPDELGEVCDLVDNLTLTLKLIKLGSSGIILTIFPSKVSQTTTRDSKIEYSLLKETEINFNDLPQFNKILKSLSKKKNDEKIKLAIDKYNYATSGLNINFSNRFIDLMTIIEMLYSPSKEEQLRFRVSLAVAKLFNKNNLKIDDKKEVETSKEKFDEMKKLYDIRSKLVHSGESNKLTNNEFLLLADIVRKSLLLYLDNPEHFKQESLLSLICE